MIEITDRRVIRQDYIVDAARGKAVLDIGCVAADGLLALHREVKTVARSCVGVDITAAPGVIQADAQNFDVGKFELIIAGEIIEHLTDLSGFFASLRRNLSPGGRIIITTPNPYSWVALRHALLGKSVPNDPFHVLLLDATVLRNLMQRASFDGRILYYEERGALSLPYRINRRVSQVIPRWSCGLLLDMH